MLDKDMFEVIVSNMKYCRDDKIKEEAVSFVEAYASKEQLQKLLQFIEKKG